ncbi:MAG: NB-ARC domain-containing protein [Cyanobacteria bacterium J06626_14]
MADHSHSPEEAFSEATHHWNLEKLYIDLADAKRKGLTRVEKQYLRGLLCHYSPNEIAEQLHVAGDTVRNYLSKGLYRYIEELLIQHGSDTIKVKDWSRVPQLLEGSGYRIHSGANTRTEQAPAHQQPSDQSSQSNDSDQLDTTQPTNEPSNHTPSSEEVLIYGIPDVPVFYGREAELQQLQTMIQHDRCRLITLLGIGGIGKTTLAAQLSTQVSQEFDCVIWRSLRTGLDINVLLNDVLQLLQPEITTPNHLDAQLSSLVTHLTDHRCLIVLEDMQLVLQGGALAGQYQPSYEGYGELLTRIAETSHQSCLLLTSWEKPREVSVLEGDAHPVRSLKIKGLGSDARDLLNEKGLSNPELWDELIVSYRGNPLALKIIATTIQELFGGSVADFLNQGTLFLGDFMHLLTQQFKRLSPLEKDVMSWFATTGEPATLPQLRTGIQAEVALSDLINVLESLGRRSLMDKVTVNNEVLFTLQPMVMKYVRRHHVDAKTCS